MHSLVDSYMWLDQGWNPRLWMSGRHSNQLNYLARAVCTVFIPILPLSFVLTPVKCSSLSLHQIALVMIMKSEPSDQFSIFILLDSSQYLTQLIILSFSLLGFQSPYFPGVLPTGHSFSVSCLCLLGSSLFLTSSSWN